jgi:hypothetical protein
MNNDLRGDGRKRPWLNRNFFLWLYSPIQALAASIKLSVSLQLLDFLHSVGLLGRVIGSSQGLYLYTNTGKHTHNTNTKLPCLEWGSYPRSRRPRECRRLIRILSWNLSGGAEKKQRHVTVRIDSVWTEIRDEHFPNTNQKHYRYAIPSCQK